MNSASQSKGISETLKFLKSSEEIRFEELEKLSLSEDATKRIMAVKLLERSGRYNTFRLLLDLLQDKNREVRKAALVASGRVKRHELWPRIIDHLSFPDYCNQAFTAISEIGAPVLHELDLYFGKLTENKETQIRIIKLFEKIGGEDAKKYLKDRLYHHDKDIRYQVLLSLSKLEYQALASEAPSIRQLITEDIEIIIWLYSSVNDIKNQDKTEELKKALEYEISAKRENIFLLLSLIYDTKTIKHIRQKLDSKDNDSRVYALEIIDMIISDDLKNLLTPILDDLSEKEMHSHYLHIFPQEKLSLPNRLKDIVNKDYAKINSWTKACALQLMISYPCDDAETQYAANLLNPNKIIMEVAACNLYKINMEKFFDISVKLDSQSRERLSDISKQLQRNEFADNSLVIDKVRLLKKISIFSDIPENVLIAPASKVNKLHTNNNIEIKFDINDHRFLFEPKGSFNLADDSGQEIMINDTTLIAEFIPRIWEKKLITVRFAPDEAVYSLDVDILYSLMTEHPVISKNIINTYYS
jgi:AAA family ATP:ADP antiporter